LILLDYRMPGMDGQQVYRALSEVDQAKVMFVTAGAYSPEGTMFLAQHPVLPKPFTPRELREAVEDRLRFLQPDRASVAATR
jgi:CheY-like chemotaxis protein